MADNFLENAMEDLHSGKYTNRVSSLSFKPKGGYSKHIYTETIDNENIDRIRTLVRSGVKVSFSYPEGHEGSSLARSLKCYYRPKQMGIPPDAEILK